MLVVVWIPAHDLFEYFIIILREFKRSLLLVVLSVSVLHEGAKLSSWSCFLEKGLLFLDQGHSRFNAKSGYPRVGFTQEHFLLVYINYLL